MKYLILGDLHCREIWKDIIAKEGIDNYDKVIFLGDYLPPRHDVTLDDPTDACGFLYEVLDFKDQHPDKVVLLRGNHDTQALGYYWAECYPKVHPRVAQYCQTEDVKNWFLKNTQWVFLIPDTNIVCSHAGISEPFLENVRKYWDTHMEQPDDGYFVPGISNINDIEPCELFGFTTCKFSDYTGESSTQPCTWIRPYTLLFHGVKDVIQVVGHTPVEHICNLKEGLLKDPNATNLGAIREYCEVWCCDCLEHGEYLVVENGEFIPKKLNESRR